MATIIFLLHKQEEEAIIWIEAEEEIIIWDKIIKWIIIRKKIKDIIKIIIIIGIIDRTIMGSSSSSSMKAIMGDSNRIRIIIISRKISIVEMNSINNIEGWDGVWKKTNLAKK